jgi:hypothetical protein
VSATAATSPGWAETVKLVLVGEAGSELFHSG